MKALLFNDEKYEAEKIVKTENSILGYNNTNILIWSFKGISDFSKFKLEEGQQFDSSDLTIDELSIALTESQLAQMQTQQLLDQALLLITELQVQIGGK